jgi:exopolysaccharide biosynthesis polyprenyl glycosylphosphotransferase
LDKAGGLDAQHEFDSQLILTAPTMNAKPGTLRNERRPTTQKIQSTQLHPISGWYLLYMRVCDIVVTVVALWLAARVRQVLPFGPPLDSEGWLSQQAFVIAPLVVAVAYETNGLYHAQRLQSLWSEIRAALRATIISTVVLAGCMYFLNRDLSRWLFVYYGVFQVVLVVLVRLVMHGLCRLAEVPIKQPRRIAIVGASVVGQEMAQRLERLHDTHYAVVGFIAESRERAAQLDLSGDLLGLIDRVEVIVRQQKIDELLIALPPGAHAELEHIMEAVHDLPVQVTVVPDYSELAYLDARSDELVGLPVVHLKEPALTPGQRAVKRVFDLILGSLLLLGAAPLLVVSALAIKADSVGPVFYRQRRIGEGSSEFQMLKLRTMVCGADRDERHMLLAQNGNLRFNKLPDDPRVTRVGKFLRRWSIDELPQLLNVLQGDMSLIGPRPELPSLVERYSAGQRKRFAVPQGMTGWWQVNGRPQDVEQKVEFDLYYVRNYSLWLDLWILVKTVSAVLSRRGAF